MFPKRNVSAEINIDRHLYALRKIKKQKRTKCFRLEKTPCALQRKRAKISVTLPPLFRYLTAARSTRYFISRREISLWDFQRADGKVLVVLVFVFVVVVRGRRGWQSVARHLFYGARFLREVKHLHNSFPRANIPNFSPCTRQRAVVKPRSCYSSLY